MSFSPQKILALYRGDAGYGSRDLADTTVFPVYAGSKPIQFVIDSDLVVQMLDTSSNVVTTLAMNQDYRVIGRDVHLLTGSLQPGTVLGIFLRQPIEQPYRLRLPDPGPMTRHSTMWIPDFTPPRAPRRPASSGFGGLQ
jgi:hypothetical protein